MKLHERKAEEFFTHEWPKITYHKVTRNIIKQITQCADASGDDHALLLSLDSTISSSFKSAEPSAHPDALFPQHPFKYYPPIYA
jgi:hypothetical protein